MKNQTVKTFMVLIAFILSITSCEKENLNDEMTSQFENDKLLVSTIVGSTVTGFSAVFENLISDSIERVEFCREFTFPIRYFEDLSGYFFTQDFHGWNVAYPTNHDLEGNYFIRDMMTIAEDPGFGFLEYYWKNPSTDADEKKMTYVYKLPDLNYFIGAGVYVQ